MQTYEIRKPEEATFFPVELKYQRILFSLFQELDLSTTILLSFSNKNYTQLIKLISLRTQWRSGTKKQRPFAFCLETKLLSASTIAEARPNVTMTSTLGGSVAIGTGFLFAVFPQLYRIPGQPLRDNRDIQTKPGRTVMRAWNSLSGRKQGGYQSS